MESPETSVETSEAPSVVEPRQPVPNISAIIQHVDQRKEQADAADAAEPEYKHVYKDSQVSEADKFRHQLTPVKHKDIYPDAPPQLADTDVAHRGDLLCRQPITEYERIKSSGEKLSQQLVEQSMKSPDNQDADEWNPAVVERNKRDPKELKGLKS